MSCGSNEQPFFLKRTQGLGADFEFHFFAVDGDRFDLQIGFPNLLRVTLGKAHIVAELFTFAGKIAFLHDRILSSRG